MNMDNIQKICDVVLKISLSILLLAIVPILPDQKAEKNYAYVDHEGGYTAIGYISRQELYTDASITGIPSGGIYGISDVRSFLESALVNDVNATINPGISLYADAGLQWTGSAGDMKLTGHRITLKSDDTPHVRDWLAALVEVESNNELNYETTASRALRYEKAPASD